MTIVNGAVVVLILAAVLIVAYLAIDHSITITERTHTMHAPTETHINNAEAYARYYHAAHPGLEAPLSYEYADMLTIGGLLQAVGADDNTDPDDIADAFESAYTEQDTVGGWKFPRCTCPQWSADPDLMEHIADTAHCPAHDGEWWTIAARATETAGSFTTRDEVVQRTIVEPINAGDACADDYNIDRIADEVVSYRNGRYYNDADHDAFWETVARHAY